MSDGEYGICANVSGDDKIARKGSRAWVLSQSGQGWSNLHCLIRTRSGRIALKWMAIKKLHRFRVKWIPDYVKQKVESKLEINISGDKKSISLLAEKMGEFKKEKL